jgi:hypothetical protein
VPLAAAGGTRDTNLSSMLEYYYACRWHQCCDEGTWTSVCRRFLAARVVTCNAATSMLMLGIVCPFWRSLKMQRRFSFL